MSTVLWTNILVDGNVDSDQSDKYALHKHLDKLDKVCRAVGLPPLSAMCDSTDARCNLGEIGLPEGMSSSNELMARDGVWVDARDAARLLERLLTEVTTKQIRFGLIGNDHHRVVAELREATEFAKAGSVKNAKFNFAIVT